ncbi:MAG: hypothetical protein K9G48_08710 [Reyranella sp.]|nr:hypothetical protein [Reyranella sp.]
MSDASSKVYTLQVGTGAGGRIEQLMRSATIFATDIPDADRKARLEVADMRGIEGCNIMLLLEDGVDKPVWWRPIPSN